MLIHRNLLIITKKFNSSILKIISSNSKSRINNVSTSSLLSSYIPGIRPRSSYKEQKYFQKDRMPNDFKLIYRAPMENYLMASKNVTTITSSLIGTVIIYQYMKGTNLVNIPVHSTHITGLIVGGSDLIYFGIGFLIITILVRVFIERYPLRIYRNRNSYIAIFEGQLPFKNERMYFEKGDVTEVPKSFSLNPWKEVTYKIKNRKTFLFIDHFKTPSELNEMLTKQ